MMKVFFRTCTICGLAAFLLGSCDPAKEFEAELKTIDSSLAELHELDSLYKGIEFDSLKYMVAHVLENESLIREYYTTDTVDMEFGMLVNSSKGIRKSLKNIDGARNDFPGEIASLQKQFGDLKTDILNGVLDKEQVKQYLAAELEALEMFSLAFHDFYTVQEEQSAIYYSVVPKVDEYVKKLNIPVEDSIQ